MRPTREVFLGLALGLAGLAVLIGPESIMGGGRVNVVGAVVLTLAAMLWAIGSVYSRHAPLPKSSLQAVSMEMLSGGVLLLALGLATGEAGGINPEAVSARSALALLYLIVFGSLIGFSAYIWLLGVVSPVKVSTYAYVNPVVAVLLGWALAGEPLTARIFVAAAVIIGAVVLLTLRTRPPAHPPQAAVPEPGLRQSGPQLPR
jgi:drug/metabolite transporter (DMT)-like permease